MAGDGRATAAATSATVDEANGGSSGGGITSSNSRWNPTKEQIDMLESLYKQGVRTPSAEQIQQIASRLRAFGHIEGKNVFYWFQNHKARQRQKQKQESLALFSRRLNTPLFPPPVAVAVPHHHHVFPPYHAPPNVTCGGTTYYVPQQNEMGFYQQSQLQQNMVRRSSSLPFENYESCTSNFPVQQTTAVEPTLTHNGPETLCLFPMHPTGILHNDSSTSTSTTVIDNDHHQDQFSGHVHQTGFFDFFSSGQKGSFVTD